MSLGPTNLRLSLNMNLAVQALTCVLDHGLDFVGAARLVDDFIRAD